ncbi:MAG: hypothetical protein ACRCZS_11890 [Chroococcidiopsis sp.]
MLTNVTGVGYNAAPTKDNQVVLGNTSVTEVLTTGQMVADSFRGKPYTTATLPTPTVSAGVLAYNATINKLVFCNGTVWQTITST